MFFQGFPTPQQDYYKVRIGTSTYNQATYIEDCLNGVAMQKTDFPFIHQVTDDASTDGEQEIIKAWMDRECDMEHAEYFDNDLCRIILAINRKNPNCTIAAYFLKKNMYGNPKKKELFAPWRKVCPYVAFCEGDDYWTDPYKLQKQVDWLENHPSCVMVCSDATIETPTGNLDWHRYDQDCNIPVKDMILGGGLFVQTATLIYRKSILENYPEYCKKCHVGDYPLQIWAALSGDVRYLAEKTATYRFQRPDSWTSNMAASKSSLKGYLSEVRMLRGLDSITSGKYHDSFEKMACTLECKLAKYGLISPLRLLLPKYWSIAYERKARLMWIGSYYLAKTNLLKRW